MVAEGLSEIDNIALFWSEFWPYIRPPRFIRGYGVPEARIRRLEISSPPQIVLLCTPEWLGVYIGIAALAWNMVATYDQFKAGLESIRKDIHNQIERIQGLTDRARQMVTDVADAFIDGLLVLAEHDLESALVRVRRIQEARSRLANLSERPHTELNILNDKTDSDDEK